MMIPPTHPSAYCMGKNYALAVLHFLKKEGQHILSRSYNSLACSANLCIWVDHDILQTKKIVVMKSQFSLLFLREANVVAGK